MTARHLPSPALAAALLGTLTGLGASPALAAERYVDPSTSIVNCESAGVEPGDTIVLRGQRRGRIQFESCRGTPAARITIRNDVSERGPLVVEHSGDGGPQGIFRCNDCEFVTVTGLGGWRNSSGSCDGIVDGSNEPGTCGIFIRPNGPTDRHYMRFDGSYRGIEVSGIGFEDAGDTSEFSGVALSINDHNYNLNAACLGGDFTRCEFHDQILVTRNYFDGCSDECMYIGANHNQGGEDDVPLSNLEISYNWVQRAKGTGIIVKRLFGGQNSIHDNYVLDVGQAFLDPDAQQWGGGFSANSIHIFDAGYNLNVYRNYVRAIDTFADRPCIIHRTENLPPDFVALNGRNATTRIHSNVLENCDSDGIVVSRESPRDWLPEDIVENNTIVNAAGRCVYVHENVNDAQSPTIVRNNLCGGTGAIVVSPETRLQKNRVSRQLDELGFRNPGGSDFRITGQSPARNGGTQNCPTADFTQRRRPLEDACDQGAYEFDDRLPKPPVLIQR